MPKLADIRIPRSILGPSFCAMFRNHRDEAKVRNIWPICPTLI